MVRLSETIKSKKFFKPLPMLFAAVFSAIVCASAVTFFSCRKASNEKRENGVYEMKIELLGDELECDFDYTESAALSGNSGDFVFCLQPNYLNACESAGKGRNAETDEENLPLKITDAFGAKFSYLHGGSYLKIEAKTQNGLKSARFKFGVRLPSGRGRLSVTSSGINLACFYPYKCDCDQTDGPKVNGPAAVGDPFSGEIADYKIELRVKSTFTVAGAAPAFCNVEGEKTVYGYNLKNFTRVAFCLSENFDVISKKSGNRLINCYFVKGEGQDFAQKEESGFYEKTLTLAASALDFFCKLYGDYPRDCYSIAFVPFFCGGMEYPALSVVSSDQSVENSIKAIVHETAHQWFPLAVVNDEYNEGFFDEGLAEFMTYKYFCSKLPDYGVKMLGAADKSIKNYARNVCGDMRMRKRLCDFSGEYEYYVAAYARGLVLFCECEKACGEKRFAASIKKFFGQNVFCFVKADDFANSLPVGAKKVFYSIVDSKAVLCLPNN